MPTVPEYNNKPMKRMYTVSDSPASLRQKNLILTLFERRKAPPPDVSRMTKQEASVLISSMLDS